MGHIIDSIGFNKMTILNFILYCFNCGIWGIEATFISFNLDTLSKNEGISDKTF